MCFYKHVKINNNFSYGNNSDSFAMKICKRKRNLKIKVLMHKINIFNNLKLSLELY